MVMHPCRALRALNYLSDLLVRHSLLNAQRKNLPLQNRQTLHRSTNPLGGFVGDHRVERTEFRYTVALGERYRIPLPLLRSPPIENEPSSDCEQPCSERAL